MRGFGDQVATRLEIGYIRVTLGTGVCSGLPMVTDGLICCVVPAKFIRIASQMLGCVDGQGVGRGKS